LQTITILGAGGKMGYRVSANLRDAPYHVRHVEISEAGRARLAELGLSSVEAEEALPESDLVILAIPDNRLGKITHQLVNLFKPGAILVALDAAAPFAGELPSRGDLSIFVAHPCHPPIFNDEVTAKAKADHFGGIAAKQHVVAAMMRGPDSHLAFAEDVARRMYAPVMNLHRVTVEHMAILEPVLSETIGATCVAIIKEATDEAVARGVPEQAAHDFILGHLNVLIAIQFGVLPGGQLSDAAKKAVELAKKDVFQPNWKSVFEPEAIARSIHMITRF
jgi:hypothetical protein